MTSNVGSTRLVIPLSSLAATCAVQITAAIIINTMPAIVSALMSLGRIGPDTAGYVVGVDLAAQVAGTIIFLAFGRRVRWAIFVGLGISLMVVGNLLSCVSDSTASLLGTRVIAGLGAGIVRSGCFVAFAYAANPARAIAALNIAQIGTMAAAFATFPALTRSIGWYGPYLVLSGLGVLIFGTAPWWPRLGKSASGPAVSLSFNRAGLICLAAVFLYFLAQAAVWAFAEAIGASVGESATHVTAALEFSAFAGVAACFFAIASSKRMSVQRCLILGLVISLTGLVLLTIKGGFWPFAIGLSLFNFAWNSTTPFEFGVAASADRSGNTAAAFSAADGLGLSAGPAIAGVMIATHHAVALNVLAALITAISIGLFVLASFLGSTQEVPLEQAR